MFKWADRGNSPWARYRNPPAPPPPPPHPPPVHFVDGYERTSRQFPVGRYSVPFYRNTFSLLIYIACLKTSKRMCISVLWDKHPEQSGTRSAPFLMKIGLENMNEWSYDLLDTVTFSRSIILFFLLSMQFQHSIKKNWHNEDWITLTSQPSSMHEYCVQLNAWLLSVSVAITTVFCFVLFWQRIWWKWRQNNFNCREKTTKTNKSNKNRHNSLMHTVMSGGGGFGQHVQTYWCRKLNGCDRIDQSAKRHLALV